MQAISDLANKVAEQSASPTPSTTSSETDWMPTQWVAALFRKFQARYGHRWTSAIEGIERVAVQEWAEGLRGMTADQVKTGLATWGGEWPPSLPEFRGACLGRKSGKNEYGLDYVPQCYRAGTVDKAKMLPGPKTEENRQKALENIRAIKEGLGVRA